MQRARGLIAILSAIVAAAAAGVSALTAAPEGDREISFYHIHTKETLSIVYKRSGKYVPEAMDKIDWLMRDWRQNKAIKMDPEAIDILWEIHTELGSKEPIHIICGYRSGDTNNMLRRTVGGQAKNSQHISGKAIDVYFPDVPPKFVRYAGLVRERGGVGYYPTSAMPFTHIDTGRVRHWPKIGKDELALIFPQGRSKHVSSGGALRPGDFERARSRNPSLYTQVAAYNDLRTGERPVVIAADFPVPPPPKAAARPEKPKPAKPATILAGLAPTAKPAPQPPAATRPEPKLVAAPRLIERPSRFAPQPTDKDRADLNSLVRLASLGPANPAPRLLAQPSPAKRPAKATAAATPAPTATPEGSYDPESEAGLGRPGIGSQWAQATAFDEDHPEELSYRPFPLGPMLTVSASPDDPALTELVHPDIAKTLEVLDEDGAVQPMRLRPQQKIAELLWAQQFHGAAVNASMSEEARSPSGLAKRAVKTTLR